MRRLERGAREVAIALAAWAGICLGSALAHGQGLPGEPPAPHHHGPHDAWFKSLKQADRPAVSCCGPEDQFYAAEYWVDPEVPGGFYVRTEAAHGRPEALVRVPPERVNWRDVHANMTGRGVIFLAMGEWSAGVHTYCFVPAMGM